MNPEWRPTDERVEHYLSRVRLWRLVTSLRNAQHRVITAYKDEDTGEESILLSVQMTRDSLDYIIEMLNRELRHGQKIS